VYVALVYVEMIDKNLAIIGGLCATAFLGHLSFVLVENPTRRILGRIPPRHIAGILIGAFAGVALPAIAIWTFKGVSGRFSAAVELAAAESDDINPRRKECHQNRGSTSPSCIFGGAKRKLILIGDSHAAAIVSSLVQAQTHGDAGVVEWSYDGCLFVPNMLQIKPERFNKGNNCKGFNKWITDQLKNVPADVPVVIVGRYARAAFGPVEDKDVPEAPEVLAYHNEISGYIFA
jgi:hypothetical protein